MHALNISLQNSVVAGWRLDTLNASGTYHIQPFTYTTTTTIKPYNGTLGCTTPNITITATGIGTNGAYLPNEPIKWSACVPLHTTAELLIVDIANNNSTTIFPNLTSTHYDTFGGTSAPIKSMGPGLFEMKLIDLSTGGVATATFKVQTLSNVTIPLVEISSVGLGTNGSYPTNSTLEWYGYVSPNATAQLSIVYPQTGYTIVFVPNDTSDSSGYLSHAFRVGSNIQPGPNYLKLLDISTGKSAYVQFTKS